MNYKECIAYLCDVVPMFQKRGATAYKEGLENTILLDKHFGSPHNNYRTIHIAGTNGKGSTSHSLASVLQDAGYRVGLYTSPHLLDFRERIRINGTPIAEEYVCKFVNEERSFFEPLQPTFFELTTALAFKYFADEKVDIAIVEVGLGGRLDCTNIISPILSVITNIGKDHTQFLGDNLESIAGEKAGIIKKGIPVVIGETKVETKDVFLEKAKLEASPIVFAEDDNDLICTDIDFELKGDCQKKNIKTISSALKLLREYGLTFSNENVRRGLANVVRTTGIMGRWQKLSDAPRLICDTGHNVDGIKQIVGQLEREEYDKLRIVIGMAADKDISHILELLPRDAIYYFSSGKNPRLASSDKLKVEAASYGLRGEAFGSVEAAVAKAKEESSSEDLLFVGGSNFIVADLLESL